MFMETFLSKIHPACHNNANRIKPRSNGKMTDKNAAGYTKTTYVFGQKLICDI